MASQKICSIALLLSFMAPIGLLLQAKDGTDTPTAESEARILEDIKYLASDELQGRAAETPGLKLGAEYIAKRWNDLGLKTDLFNGSPFQEFALDGTIEALGDSNTLSITQPDGQSAQLELTKSFQPQSLGSSGTFQGDLVFAGYGITAAEENLKYDDFENFDVKGKVVIVLRKEPQQSDPKSPFDGTEPSQFALFTAKERNVAVHGAAALILVNDSVSEKDNPGTILPVAGAGAAISREQVPTIMVSRKIVEEWLSKAGHSLSEIETQIDGDLKPRSFALDGWKVSGEVKVGRAKLPSMNVLGVLPGQGNLAEEYVVLGAHFDHVGMGGAGSLAPGTIAVHNGADDNGSGTVCLMETARRIKDWASKQPSDVPRRSFLFIAFSGEERGLLGSQYYVKHPRFDLDKTVTMLNMDMVGRLNDNNLTVYGTGTATEMNTILTDANQGLAFNLDRNPEGLGPSDHQSFFQVGIPVLHFFTGLHDDYHRPSDDFDKINLNGIARITDMVTTIATRVATSPKRLTFVKVQGTANPGATNVPRRVRLGIRAKTDAQGVVVDRTMPNGVAKNAGILAGDQILKIGEDEVTSRAEMDRILQKYKIGDKVVVLVQRGEEKIEIPVELSQ